MMASRLLHTILFLSVACVAQGQQWDFLTWHSLKAGGELTKKISLSVEQQVRLNQNSLHFDETFTDVELGYDLPKGFDVSAAYRFSWALDKNQTLFNRHRYSIDIGYAEKIWKLKTKFRARFQHRPSASLFNDRLEPDDSPMFVRLKLSVEYTKLKKWTPGLAFEAFIRVEDPNQAGAQKFRYRAFLNYNLPKRQEVGLFYILETDHAGYTPVFASIVGINYSFEWKRPKKKKKKDKK